MRPPTGISGTAIRARRRWASRLTRIAYPGSIFDSRSVDALSTKASNRPKRIAMVSIIAAHSASSAMSAPQRRGVPARAADGFGDGFRAFGTLPVVHDDVGVGAGELPRDLRADAPRSA